MRRDDSGAVRRMNGKKNAFLASLRAFFVSRKAWQEREEARLVDHWAVQPFGRLLAEARLRAARLPASKAGARLTAEPIEDPEVLLARLRELRIEVCSQFDGAARFVDSGIHELLVALKRRPWLLAAQRQNAGVFR